MLFVPNFLKGLATGSPKCLKFTFLTDKIVVKVPDFLAVALQSDKKHLLYLSVILMHR